MFRIVYHFFVVNSASLNLLVTIALDHTHPQYLEMMMSSYLRLATAQKGYRSWHSGSGENVRRVCLAILQDLLYKGAGPKEVRERQARQSSICCGLSVFVCLFVCI